MLQKNWKTLAVIYNLLIIIPCTYIISGEMRATSEEKAFSELIIEARWGSEPGECGLYIGKGEGDLTRGPTSFTVNTRGYTYISDGVNSRINIYGREGNFIRSIPADGIGDIAVAEDGRIYADDGSSIRIYSEDSEILGEYRYQESWREAELRIGSIARPKRMGVTDKGNAMLYGGPQPYFFELNIGDSSCGLIQREGRLGYGGGIQSWSWDIDENESKIILDDLTTPKSVSISLPGENSFMQFVGSDNNGNFFFSRYYPPAEKSKGYTRVYKYDNRGELVASIDLLHPIYQYPGGSGAIISEIALDVEGNVYRPNITYEGFKIRKYYFQKE